MQYESFNIYYLEVMTNVNSNKRHIGHIAHLRNQFKSMNTLEQSYDYIYYKTDPVVQEEKIFKLFQCIFAILLFVISPWKRPEPFI